MSVFNRGFGKGSVEESVLFYFESIWWPSAKLLFHMSVVLNPSLKVISCSVCL